MPNIAPASVRQQQRLLPTWFRLSSFLFLFFSSVVDVVVSSAKVAEKRAMPVHEKGDSPEPRRREKKEETDDPKKKNQEIKKRDFGEPRDGQRCRKEMPGVCPNEAVAAVAGGRFSSARLP
ncbi:hypothetical protein TW95_gp1204 [Pandoravirus inopinatum]|uniref:Uncharacterized protein n=1 Tax=Pandoravirus inopinatum TaxID=1605721 RepID=A0A0B5IYH6_9VIRU|nr:hypothetical protein TW95_gp1204 [Pandoravirus inopinatum]AJF97938.1 hypothetical protein [Pandoravirus inopinatum]